MSLVWSGGFSVDDATTSRQRPGMPVLLRVAAAVSRSGSRQAGGRLGGCRRGVPNAPAACGIDAATTGSAPPPPLPAEPGAVEAAASSDHRPDPTRPQGPAVLVMVVAAVGDQRPRLAARPAMPTRHHRQQRSDPFPQLVADLQSCHTRLLRLSQQAAILCTPAARLQLRPAPRGRRSPCRGGCPAGRELHGKLGSGHLRRRQQLRRTQPLPQRAQSRRPRTPGNRPDPPRLRLRLRSLRHPGLVGPCRHPSAAPCASAAAGLGPGTARARGVQRDGAVDEGHRRHVRQAMLGSAASRPERGPYW
jgi:hypothetical protein